MYAALAGVRLPEHEIDLGQGVKVRRLYAHVFSATMVAFKRPEPGKPHPAPWKAVTGGAAFDVEGELYVPPEYSIDGVGASDCAWWLVAGLRIVVGTPTLTVPALAEMSFGEMATAPGTPAVWAVEAGRHRLIPGGLDCAPGRLDWYAAHWHEAGRLAAKDERFSLLVRAADEALFAPTTGLATIMIWGALEALFLRERQELSFRIASALAAYLEAAGPGRLERYRAARKLYDARSRAAHGASQHDSHAFVRTWSLARDVIMRIAAARHVPSPDEVLELLLSGATSEQTSPRQDRHIDE